MIDADNHRPSPRAYGRERRELRRPAGTAAQAGDRRTEKPRQRRRISRRGWAVLAAVVAAAALWGILILAIAYLARHYSVAQLR